MGGWVDPRAVLDALVKRKIPSPRRESNSRTPIVRPVAQRYTDWAVTALFVLRTDEVTRCWEKVHTEHFILWSYIKCKVSMQLYFIVTNMISPLVLSYKTQYLRDEHKLSVFWNKDRRKIFAYMEDEVNGRYKILHKEKLCDLILC
jgi:hypothetical protein